jgi:hypothetical protein
MLCMKGGAPLAKHKGEAHIATAVTFIMASADTFAGRRSQDRGSQ